MAHNVRSYVEGDDLVIRVNRKELQKPSSTGNSMIVGGTQGWGQTGEPDDEGLAFSLTVIRKGGSAKRALAAVKAGTYVPQSQAEPEAEAKPARNGKAGEPQAARQ